MVDKKIITITSIFAAIFLGTVTWIGLSDDPAQRDATYELEQLGYSMITCDDNLSSHYHIAYMTNRTSSSDRDWETNPRNST